MRSLRRRRSGVLHIDGGETADTAFENLAFTNGGGTGFGGGLRIVDGSPRFENCLITGCAAGVKGGGMIAECGCWCCPCCSPEYCPGCGG